MRRTLGFALLCSAIAPPARGQGLEEARAQLARDLGSLHFAKAFGSLVLVSDELELGGARYRFDDDPDSELRVLALPFHRSFHPAGEDRVGVYVEGAVGYARAESRVDDLYDGALPGLETGIENTWTSYGALVGVGPEIPLRSDLSLAAVFNLGLSRLENRASYSGPGADITRALADGIAFNWSSLALTSGGALRLDFERVLAEHHRLAVVTRYDMRWVDSLDEDDEAQEFSTRNQLFTVCGDLTGPTGLVLFQRDLGWRATASYRTFVEGDLFDADDLVSVGGALELDVEGALPIGSKVSVSGAVIDGRGVSGWAVGVGLAF